MKKLFIGIDVSKDVFDFCFLSQDNELVTPKGQLPNTVDGIAKLFKLIHQFKSYDTWVFMEHTGYYAHLLAVEFTKNNQKFTLLNPLELKRSMGIIRGKTDAKDAYRIASYAMSNASKLKPYSMPVEQLQKLKVMMSIRDRLTKVLVQLKNGLKACKIVAPSIDISEQIASQEAFIAQNELQIKLLEEQMMELINAHKDLSESFNKATQVVGIGQITAIKCIVETDNFSRFTNARKFSCHCGLAPFEYRSGSSVRGRTRTSHLSDRALKSLFFKAASSAIQHDPQLKQYYKRKCEEGKHKLSALNAVANKLVLRVFAVIHREEPFVKFSY